MIKASTRFALGAGAWDPVTGQTYTRDPRYVAQKAETYLKSTGLGEAAYFGPEAEFFVFNEVSGVCSNVDGGARRS